MWIIYKHTQHHSPASPDRHVYDVVEDADILFFRDRMGAGTKHYFNPDMFFLQDFFESKSGTRYYVRKYEPFTTQYTGKTRQVELMAPDTQLVSQPLVWELPNPCNIAQ